MGIRPACACMHVASFNLTVSFYFIFSRNVFLPRAALLLWAFPTSSTRATVLLHCTTNTRMPPPRIDSNARLGAIGKGCWNSDQHLSFTSSTSEMYWLLSSCLSPKLMYTPPVCGRFHMGITAACACVHVPSFNHYLPSFVSSHNLLSCAPGNN